MASFCWPYHDGGPLQISCVKMIAAQRSPMEKHFNLDTGTLGMLKVNMQCQKWAIFKHNHPHNRGGPTCVCVCHQDGLHICLTSFCHVGGNIFVWSQRTYCTSYRTEGWCLQLRHLIACLVFWSPGCFLIYIFKVQFAKEAHVFPPGGVLLPSGVSGSHRGGGDAHQTGSGQGRTGEVSAIQRCLHRPQERKGRSHMRSFILSEWWFSTVIVKWNQFNLPSLSHPIFSFPALLFMPDQEVLSLHLVLHLPVLQKVNSLEA